MRLVISHETVYQFSGPVFLEPHTLRLLPRHDPAQRPLAFSMRLEPAPQAITAMLDPWNNGVHRAWFLGTTDRLVIETRCRVDTLRENPFDFLPESLAELEREPTAAQLAPCLARDHARREREGLVERLAGELHLQTGDDPLAYCLALCQRLHADVEKVSRHEPGVLSPEAVLGGGQGACRDMALLYLDACRVRGLPARLVSGYQLPALGPAPETAAESGDGPGPIPENAMAARQDLHAWAEVYLPGGGWRGFDPTHGLAVANRHVALCAAPRWEQTMPVSGAFRGDGVTATLRHAVEVRED